MWEDEGIARCAVWLRGFSLGVDGWSREDIVMAYVDSEAPLKVLMAKVYRERRVWGDPADPSGQREGYPAFVEFMAQAEEGAVSCFTAELTEVHVIEDEDAKDATCQCIQEGYLCVVPVGYVETLVAAAVKGDPNTKKVNLLIPPPSPVWKVADSTAGVQ